MVVVHQTAEVQHIRIVALAVQAVQDGYKPASQGWEYHIRISSYLYEVTPQAGEVFDQDEIDKAASGILQHLLETRALEVAAAVPIVPVGLDLHPAIEHHKFGKNLVLIFDADGFIARDVVFCLCGIDGILNAQAAVDTHFIQLLHTGPALPASVHRPRCRRTGNIP